MLVIIMSIVPDGVVDDDHDLNDYSYVLITAMRHMPQRLVHTTGRLDVH